MIFVAYYRYRQNEHYISFSPKLFSICLHIQFLNYGVIIWDNGNLPAYDINKGAIFPANRWKYMFDNKLHTSTLFDIIKIMQNVWPFLPCILREIPWNVFGRTDRKNGRVVLADKQSYRRTKKNSQGWSVGRTDYQKTLYSLSHNHAQVIQSRIFVSMEMITN